MQKRGLLSGRKGDIGAETVIFMILNLVFFAVLLAFILRASTNAIVYEQAYAKELALLIDEAKPGMEVYLHLPKLPDFVKSNKLKNGTVVRIDGIGRRVIVDLTGKGGASFQFYSEGDFSVEVKGEYVIIGVMEPKVVAASATKELNNSECKSNLSDRKRALGIPDKLCYWQEMTKIYDSKCENLNSSDVSAIFEKKAEYRLLNSPDWPSLKNYTDFCVPVIFDCDAWDRANPLAGAQGVVAGFFNPNSNTTGIFHPSVSGSPSGEMQINPYALYSKEVFYGFLIHEGLHAIQSRLSNGSHLGEGANYAGLLSQTSLGGELVNMEGVLEIWENLSKVTSALWKKTWALQITISTQIGATIKLPSSAEKDKKLAELNADFNDSRYLPAIVNCPNFQVIEPDLLSAKYLKVKDLMTKYLAFDSETEKAYNSALSLNSQAYFTLNEYQARGYIGSKVEVDPRLSEVQRWWLDKTAPNCEIIFTKDKAKQAFDLFLNETNMPVPYDSAQADLKLLMYIYKGTTYEEKVYNDLIGRLPGLAYTEPTGGGEALA